MWTNQGMGEQRLVSMFRAKVEKKPEPLTTGDKCDYYSDIACVHPDNESGICHLDRQKIATQCKFKGNVHETTGDGR